MSFDLDYFKMVFRDVLNGFLKKDVFSVENIKELDRYLRKNFFENVRIDSVDIKSVDGKREFVSLFKEFMKEFNNRIEENYDKLKKDSGFVYMLYNVVSDITDLYKVVVDMFSEDESELVKEFSKLIYYGIDIGYDYGMYFSDSYFEKLNFDIIDFKYVVDRLYSSFLNDLVDFRDFGLLKKCLYWFYKVGNRESLESLIDKIRLNDLRKEYLFKLENFIKRGGAEKIEKYSNVFDILIDINRYFKVLLGRSLVFDELENKVYLKVFDLKNVFKFRYIDLESYYEFLKLSNGLDYEELFKDFVDNVLSFRFRSYMLKNEYYKNVNNVLLILSYFIDKKDCNNDKVLELDRCVKYILDKLKKSVEINGNLDKFDIDLLNLLCEKIYERYKENKDKIYYLENLKYVKNFLVYLKDNKYIDFVLEKEDSFFSGRWSLKFGNLEYDLYSNNKYLLKLLFDVFDIDEYSLVDFEDLDEDKLDCKRRNFSFYYFVKDADIDESVLKLVKVNEDNKFLKLLVLLDGYLRGNNVDIKDFEFVDVSLLKYIYEEVLVDDVIEVVRNYFSKRDYDYFDLYKKILFDKDLDFEKKIVLLESVAFLEYVCLDNFSFKGFGSISFDSILERLDIDFSEYIGIKKSYYNEIDYGKSFRSRLLEYLKISYDIYLDRFKLDGFRRELVNNIIDCYKNDDYLNIYLLSNLLRFDYSDDKVVNYIEFYKKDILSIEFVDYKLIDLIYMFSSNKFSYNNEDLFDFKIDCKSVDVKKEIKKFLYSIVDLDSFIEYDVFDLVRKEEGRRRKEEEGGRGDYVCVVDSVKDVLSRSSIRKLYDLNSIFLNRLNKEIENNINLKELDIKKYLEIYLSYFDLNIKDIIIEDLKLNVIRRVLDYLDKLNLDYNLNEFILNIIKFDNNNKFINKIENNLDSYNIYAFNNTIKLVKYILKELFIIKDNLNIDNKIKNELLIGSIKNRKNNKNFKKII